MFYHAKITQNNRIIAPCWHDLLLILLDFVAIIRSDLNIGIYAAELVNKFLLPHGRDNKRHGAFQYFSVGKGDGEAVDQRCRRGRKHALCRLDALYLVDGISCRNKELINH